MEPPLPCEEIEPEGPADCAIVWLHGLGADGYDFVPIVPLLRLEPDVRARFLFPHAPSIPVTINAGFVMPAWYDVRGADLDRRPDEEGILRSSAVLERFVARERERGIPPERVVVAGFSQGGAIAAHVALRHAEPLAGLVALSTYLVRGESLPDEASPAFRGLPVFQAHGTHDPMVPFERGEAARDRLVALGAEVVWRSYPMGHEVVPEEIAHLGAWLREHLGAPRGT